MRYISQNSKIRIEWTVMKGHTDVCEDFSRARVVAFVHCGLWRKAVDCRVDGDAVVLDMADYLPEGVYDVSLLWVKNTVGGLAGDAVAAHRHVYWHGHERFDGPYRRSEEHDPLRCVMRARVNGLFAISARAGEGEDEGGMAVFKVKTRDNCYAYDGLDAYELGVWKGVVSVSEEEWLGYINLVPSLLAGQTGRLALGFEKQEGGGTLNLLVDDSVVSSVFLPLGGVAEEKTYTNNDVVFSVSPQQIDKGKVTKIALSGRFEKDAGVTEITLLQGDSKVLKSLTDGSKSITAETEVSEATTFRCLVKIRKADGTTYQIGRAASVSVKAAPKYLYVYTGAESTLPEDFDVTGCTRYDQKSGMEITVNPAAGDYIWLIAAPGTKSLSAMQGGQPFGLSEATKINNGVAYRSKAKRSAVPHTLTLTIS